MTDLLTGHLPPITLDDMIAEVRRELSLRERVYARWVEQGILRPGIAEEQMRRMRAVLDNLLAQREGR